MIDKFYDVVDVNLNEEGDLTITITTGEHVFLHGNWNGMRISAKHGQRRNVEVTHAEMRDNVRS